MKQGPLTDASLVTRARARAELQVSEAKLSAILARVTPVRVGDGSRDRRWRWGDVVASLPADGEAPARRAQPTKRPVVPL